MHDLKMHSRPRSLSAIVGPMAPVRRRLIDSIGANAYGQVVNLAIQLLSMPILLSHWTLEQYGLWIVVSSIPAYLSMSDFGLLGAASNRISMLAATGDFGRANRIFQSTFALICLVSAAVLLTGTCVWLSTKAWPSSEVAHGGALLMLAASVLLSLFGSLNEAGLRACDRYAMGSAALSSARLVEWFGMLAGFAGGRSIESTAAGCLLGRLCATFGIWAWSLRLMPQFSWSWRLANRADLKDLLGPAMGFMAFPLGNALAMQGVLLALAATAGPVAAAIFGAYRTLTRALVQFVAIGSRSVGPEFTRLLGQGRADAAYALHHKARLVGLLVSICGSALLFVAGPLVLHSWTQGKVVADSMLLALFCMGAAAVAASHVSCTLLLSINGHGLLAGVFVFTSLLAVICPFALGPLGSLAASAAGVVATEILLACATEMICRDRLRQVGSPFEPRAST